MSCDGKREYYSSQGAGATYAFSEEMAICLKSQDEALWIATNTLDDEVLFGKECLFYNKQGWECKILESLDSIEIKAKNLTFFDEDRVFGSQRLCLKD